VSQTGVEFLLEGIKAPRKQDDGRILLGDNTDCGGGYAATDQVPMCWNLDFYWTPSHTHLWFIICWPTPSTDWRWTYQKIS